MQFNVQHACSSILTSIVLLFIVLRDFSILFSLSRLLARFVAHKLSFCKWHSRMNFYSMFASVRLSSNHFYFIFSFFSAECFAITFMITEMARHILPQLENKPQMTTKQIKKTTTNKRWSKERCTR